MQNFTTNYKNKMYLYSNFRKSRAGVQSAIFSQISRVHTCVPRVRKYCADEINRNKTVVQKAVSGVVKTMKTAMNSENMAFSFDNNSLISGGKTSAGTTNNYYNTDNSRTINQTNTSPKSLSRLEIYRQTRNALKV